MAGLESRSPAQTSELPPTGATLWVRSLLKGLRPAVRRTTVERNLGIPQRPKGRVARVLRKAGYSPSPPGEPYAEAVIDGEVKFGQAALKALRDAGCIETGLG